MLLEVSVPYSSDNFFNDYYKCYEEYDSLECYFTGWNIIRKRTIESPVADEEPPYPVDEV